MGQLLKVGRRYNGQCSPEVWHHFSTDLGAQLVEMAVTLPLLVVLFVGIFDVGQAVNLKQKLSGAAREGARFASSQSTADLSQSPPQSILAVRDVVDAYLVTNRINDCGLASQNPGPPSGWTWTFTTGSCGGGSLVLTVNRGFTIPSNSGVTVEATQVQITYPYKWQFSNVLQLFSAGASYTTTNVATDAIMQNVN
jgi:Flp pilus assembly protein TadG